MHYYIQFVDVFDTVVVLADYMHREVRADKKYLTVSGE